MTADDLQSLIAQRQAEAAAQENAAREEQRRRQEREQRRQTDLYNFNLSVPWLMTAAQSWNLQLRGVAELTVGSSPKGDQARIECNRTGGNAKHASGSISFGLDGNGQIVARSTVSIDAPMSVPLDRVTFEFFNTIVKAFVAEMMRA